MTAHRASGDPQPDDPPISELEPADPEEVGVEPETPDAMQLEAARLLANDARAELRDRGFDDRQIDRWANTYVAEHGTGDLGTFLSWVARQEGSG
jgi:hypothetical protein